MSVASSRVSQRMKRGIYLAAVLATTTAFAADSTVDEKFEKQVRKALPVCADMTLSRQDFNQKLPAGMKGSIVRVESPRHACDGQYLAITSASGAFFLGSPWLIGDEQGATAEERIKNFAWTRMQYNVAAEIDRDTTREGMFPLTLYQTTERGKVPLYGLIDREGKVVFIGNFVSANAEPSAARLKAFDTFIAGSPMRGAEKPDVTVVEFSDFQCPSCKHSAQFVDPIVAKHPGRVRYVRYDLPLVSNHPWALGATLAGRAIYRQKPDLFWDFKKQVYENQDKLSAFTFYDWARGWAQDHELDMAKFDADVESEETRAMVLKGVGTAFSNEVRGTPTYMVNGIFVDAGDDGKALAAYVDGLLK